MTADRPTRPATPQPCGCRCGCHQGGGTVFQGCKREADWLPEYKVWACKECLAVCDG